jgi:hypothetical protein
VDAWQVIGPPPWHTPARHIPPVPHSALVKHSTHRPLPVLQYLSTLLVDATHIASVVQPAWQVCVFTLQTGRAIGQSVFARQATQVLDVVSQNAPFGLFLQSPFAAHCTHCCVVGSQTIRLARVQSVAVRQPTHAPVAMSQMGVPAAAPPHILPPSPAHDARHVWVAGSQTWPMVQSALVAQTSQLPSTQILAFMLPGGGQPMVLLRH